ncbi:MAG: Maf family protein [Ilumatobacteraceae bacterium]|nr:Maf family protein [Ilumatobacteraceae bacterium]
MTAANRLVLASASPRRRRLLTSIGLVFDVSPADVDETELPGEPPTLYVERIAASKARAVVSRTHGPELEHAAVLAADTTVDVDGEILAKPLDDDDARRMLRRLSGRTHRVHTAVFGWGPDGEHAVTVTTDVTFARLSEQGIDWYLSMGEHLDKAGAYGMQDAGGALVHRIEGSPSNVIGLPLAETIGVLRACGVAVTGG